MYDDLGSRALVCFISYDASVDRYSMCPYQNLDPYIRIWIKNEYTEHRWDYFTCPHQDPHAKTASGKIAYIRTPFGKNWGLKDIYWSVFPLLPTCFDTPIYNYLHY